MSENIEKKELEKEFSSKSSQVVLKNITKIFPNPDGNVEVIAVNNVDLEIKDGELTTLLGPSGCGKTTILRMVAGFEVPTSGDIFLGEDNVVNVAPNKRDIAMVFQSYALFPHLTIYENISYGLRIRGLSKQEVKDRADKAVELMQLEKLKNRFPAQVSGGQQQRVALARAVVIEPKVLLFDEPLSNLDAKLREYMRDELRKLQKRLGITSLYVTHDQSEAMAISDKVVIMNNGLIEQVGTPQEIYEYPNSVFVADFIGKSNFIDTKIVNIDELGVHIDFNGSKVVATNHGNAQVDIGDDVKAAIRPESIHLSKDTGIMKGTVTKAVYFGYRMEYEVKCLDTVLFVEEYNPQKTGMFKNNDEVYVNVDLDSVRLLKG